MKPFKLFWGTLYSPKCLKPHEIDLAHFISTKLSKRKKKHFKSNHASVNYLYVLKSIYTNVNYLYVFKKEQYL